MSAQLIDGKKIAAEVREKIRAEVETLIAEGTTPGLAVILVGNDPASGVYVNNKIKVCEAIGVASKRFLLSEDTSQEELISLVRELNRDDSVDGILVQLPLPKQIDEGEVIRAISPDKDVDAFHMENVGAIMIGDYRFLPCTPAGVMELIQSTGRPIAGAECVVIGRSNIVGKPMAMLLLHEHGTVTICHSRTKDLAQVAKRADILVVAVGRKGFVTADMVKPGAVVIDVGTNRGEDGKFYGDVDFQGVSQVAGYITPVPGGVGPMTIAMLMKNTLESAKNRKNRRTG